MWARRGLAARTGRHQEIEALEHSLMDPDVRRSPDRLKKILHPEFIELGSSGRVYQRQQMIDTMSQETASVGVVVRDLEAHQISEDTVLVTYRSIGGSGDEARRSSLWVNTENGWQLRFHQGTRIANSWGHIS